VSKNGFIQTANFRPTSNLSLLRPKDKRETATTFQIDSTKTV